MDTPVGQCVFDAHLPALAAGMFAMLMGLILSFALL
jgi:hypothetical protein